MLEQYNVTQQHVLASAYMSILASQLRAVASWPYVHIFAHTTIFDRRSTVAQQPRPRRPLGNERIEVAIQRYWVACQMSSKSFPEPSPDSKSHVHFAQNRMSLWRVMRCLNLYYYASDALLYKKLLWHDTFYLRLVDCPPRPHV